MLKDTKISKDIQTKKRDMGKGTYMGVGIYTLGVGEILKLCLRYMGIF